MASVTGLSNSNYVSSLYNSSKTISGLASGLDTESMIEGLTKSYQTKITQLQQKQTKLGWKQDAYQSIISKMYSFNNKYTSYTSSTNLMSQSYWNSARTSSPTGTYANKVSASGTTTSDILLNSVSQLATAARYATGGNFSGVSNGKTISGDVLDILGDDANIEQSTLNGTLSFTYGNKDISIAFSESDIIEVQSGESKAEALARVINEKLGDETITLSDGSNVAASDRISVTADASGTIRLADKSSAGNSVYISGASGTVGDVLGLGDLSNSNENKSKTSFSVASDLKLSEEVNRLGKMSGKTMNINFNGTTKKISMPTVEETYDGYTVNGKEVAADELADKYAEALNEAIQKEFGNKIEVSNAGTGGKMQLEFNVKGEGNELLINTDAGEALGIGKVASNYLSTGKTLEDLGFDFDGLTPNKDGKYDFVINGKTIGSYDKDTALSTIMSDINSKSDVKVSYSKTSRQFVFTAKETGEHTEVDFGSGIASAMFGRNEKVDTTKKTAEVLGESIAGKTFSVNVDGKDVSFKFNKDSGSMDDMLNKLNSNLGSGYQASLANDGSLVIKKNGQAVDYSFGANDEIAQKLTSKLQEQQSIKNADGYTAGQDSKFTVTVNGAEMTMERSDNKVELDGLTINFKGKFTADEDDAVSFQSEVKTDKIVDDIKNMLAEYNVMVAEIRGQYATMPAKSSSGSLQTYEPLTDEDMASMSESAIKNYEEKAKQGLLFADSNLSNLYNNLVSIFNPVGSDSTMLSKMGISLSYDTNGAATIALDENKLRDALESDFDGVVEIFTRSSENGGSTNGIMQNMKTQLDRYGATTGAVKGILVQQSGTPLASLTLLDNAWQKQIDSYTSQIEKWQEKLESQVDRYTKLFTRLETLTNQMNSQSSALAGLMGGTGA